MNNLTSEQLIRYRRQLILKEVGQEGQKKLLDAKVLIIGAGGLGSPIALYLAAAGIGKIGLVDSDCVDLSNLQRQIIHSTEKVGVQKVKSAEERLLNLNTDVHIDTYFCEIDQTNVNSIIKDYDIVVNAVDNAQTRYILNEACFTYNKPLVEGAIYNFEGHVMTIIPGDTACYECIFPEGEVALKGEIGVIGALPGVIGSLQAMEVLKFILMTGKLLKNRMLYYNGLTATFREIEVEKDNHCKICGHLKK